MATGGWDNDPFVADRPTTSSSSRPRNRPMTASVREVDNYMSEKAKDMPDPMQKTFIRGMTSLYEQESETMLSFLSDIRRSLISTVDELRDEQEALSSTSDRISQNRRDSVYVPPSRQSFEAPKPKIECRRLNSDGAVGSAKNRRGVISARAQRIASAARERTPARGADGNSTNETSLSSAPMNPLADYLSTIGAARPTTAGTGSRSPRPTTAGAGRSPEVHHRSAPGSMSSSMDSVTFESELTRVGSDRRHSPRMANSLAVPGTQAPGTDGARSPARSRSPSRNERAVSPAPASRAAPPAKTTTMVFAAPAALQQEPNTDDEYEEEKDAVMRQMSGVNSQIDKERERQKAMLRDRQEKKKVKHVENELLASEMVREASLLGEQKRKEKERQENLIRERLEERKKRKNEITVVVDVEDRRPTDVSNGNGGNVVHVSQSHNQTDTTKQPTTKNGRKISKVDSGLGSELSEVIEMETH